MVDKIGFCALSAPVTQCDISATNLAVHCINLATILSLWESHNVFLTWFYVHFLMQMGVRNSKVTDISNQAFSNFLIMEFSFMNEETIIKLSTPDTCELMFTLKMCLWWLGAKVLRRTKNLSCLPFLQNEKKN